jgi:thioredoxin-dependent peroxiredoxin
MLFKKILGSPTLKIGDNAPSFDSLDQDSQVRRLSDFKGSWLVLYFYPRDESYGCTKEACSFRDEFEGFRGLETAVVGVSVDDVASHKAFATRHRLNFPLLADTTKKVSQDYGVLMVLGAANRVTFLIDPQGVIRDIVEWAKWDSYGETIRKRLELARNSA